MPRSVCTVLALIIAGFLQNSVASTMTCRVQGDASAPRVISWDGETKKAVAHLGISGEATGELALVRPHAQSNKYNITLRPNQKYLNDEVEVLIFPVSDVRFRVIAIGYKTIDGIRYMNSSLGNSEATCTEQ